jgi:hypothetical protein
MNDVQTNKLLLCPLHAPVQNSKRGIGKFGRISGSAQKGARSRNRAHKESKQKVNPVFYSRWEFFTLPPFFS